MNPEKIATCFPSSIQMPDELRQLCLWNEQHGYPISGHFELRSDEHQAIKYWFGTERVLNRFGVFGAGPDGALFAFWIQDDERIPVVHLGSEGENNCVLAGNFIDFLRLLAVGYSEIGFDDLTSTADPEGINPAFQQWVRDTFKVSIPEKGFEITAPAQAEHQYLQAWIDQVLAG